MVYCFGEILWDFFPEGALPGGAPLNVCINLHKLGIPTKIISAIGKDTEGLKMLKYLEDSKVDTSFIQIHDQLITGKVSVNLDDEANAHYDIEFPVAYDEISDLQIPEKEFKQSDFLVFGSLALRNEISRNTLFELAKQPIIKVFDVNFRKPYVEKALIVELLNLANWIKLNEDEFAEICSWYGLNPNDDATFNALADTWKVELICVTKGGDGASLYIDQEIFHQQGLVIKVEDTVGAGDAFLAGLLYSYIENRPDATILSNACTLGAFVAEKKGANPAYQLKDLKGFV